MKLISGLMLVLASFSFMLTTACTQSESANQGGAAPEPTEYNDILVKRALVDATVRAQSLDGAAVKTAVIGLLNDSSAEEQASRREYAKYVRINTKDPGRDGDNGDQAKRHATEMSAYALQLAGEAKELSVSSPASVPVPTPDSHDYFSLLSSRAAMEARLRVIANGCADGHSVQVQSLIDESRQAVQQSDSAFNGYLDINDADPGRDGKNGYHGYLSAVDQASQSWKLISAGAYLSRQLHCVGAN